MKRTEKTILKSIDTCYKYIARDSNNDLNVYEVKPTKSISKGYWDSDRYCPINVFSQYFEWIKWEDKEPYRISDLIEGD